MTEDLMQSEPGRLALPGVATIRTIAGLHDEIQALLQSHDRIVIDCSPLTEADLSLVQLLLSARRSAMAAGKSLALGAPASGVLHEVLRRGGLLAAQDGLADDDAAFWLEGAAA